MIATNPDQPRPTPGCDKPGCDGPRVCSLAQLNRGQCGVICGLHLDEPDQAVLDSMGLSRDARVRVCRGGEPCIVVAEGAGASACRFGLTRDLARKVMVTAHTD